MRAAIDLIALVTARLPTRFVAMRSCKEEEH
jgi:hypothetical protein